MCSSCMVLLHSAWLPSFRKKEKLQNNKAMQKTYETSIIKAICVNLYNLW